MFSAENFGFTKRAFRDKYNQPLTPYGTLPSQEVGRFVAGLTHNGNRKIKAEKLPTNRKKVNKPDNTVGDSG